MEVKHPSPLTRSQRLVLSLLGADWMTGADLARAVNAKLGATRHATPQGVHQTVASLVRRGMVEKYRFRGVVRFRSVPAAKRAPYRIFTVEETRSLREQNGAVTRALGLGS